MDGDDWQPGDIALCISDTDYDGAPLQIKSGCAYTVIDVFIGDDADYARDDVLGLELKEATPSDGCDGFEATCFIKITPEAADEFDQEIISLMNTKPVPAEGV